jgi:cytochrome b
MSQSPFNRHTHDGVEYVRVWDPFVRIFHWSVVLLFTVAYVTEDDLLSLHVWAGYLIGVLVALRFLWGFIGPRHARFSDFIASPPAVRSYLADLLRFRGRRHLGHSPAGGAMVIALMGMLLLIVLSGMALYAARDGAGPLAQFVPVNRSLSRSIKGVHEILANVTVALIGLHILGVLLASLVHGENLIRSMINGRKARRTT